MNPFPSVLLQKTCPSPKQWYMAKATTGTAGFADPKRNMAESGASAMPEGKLASVGNVTQAKKTNLPNEAYFFQSCLAALK